MRFSPTDRGDGGKCVITQSKHIT